MDSANAAPKPLTDEQKQRLAEYGLTWFDGPPRARHGLMHHPVAWSYHLGRWESNVAHVDKALREVQ